MIKKLYPTHYIESIFDLPIHELKDKGIKGVIFDIDNTLVPYDVPEPTKEIISFFNELKKAEIAITLVSNNTEDRVVKFNEKLKVLALHKAQKPFTKSFKKALEMMHCTKEQAVIVGDQIFTDVYGGNCVGIATYLVKPISDKDEWQTKVKRGLERQVIKSYMKHQKQQA